MRVSSIRGGGPVGVAALVLMTAVGCGDTEQGASVARFDLLTTRLCPLVPARDAADGGFRPGEPVEIFGTDLGWTYDVDGRIPILFGDTWQRVDACPFQPNDDSLGTLHLPAADWPGFEAVGSIPDAQCPDITYELDASGTSFAPITLERWDGVPVPLGPLNTPLTGFFDGRREWGVFIVGGGQACSDAEAASGAPCPSRLSAQAADLVCGPIGGRSLCLDPTSTRGGDGAQAFYLHIAERTGPAAYVSRAMFLTNKYLNLTARAVRAFDPTDARGRDYASGQGVLLMWGRPGFNDLSGDGEAPPYFMYHPLPFDVVGDRIDFRPQYLTMATEGGPGFGSHQAAAVPLYTGEFEPVNQAAVSWVPPLRRWLMIYGGGSTDSSDPDRRTGRGQPIPGALYARVAPDPWGPWSDAAPILTNAQTAQDLVCGHQSPPGCVPSPDPLIRPACIEAVDPGSGGALYGANIIDAMTRARPSPGGGLSADVFWNFSTWHPYGVVLARTRIEVE